VANSKIPDPMNRRHLIEKEMDASSALAIAEAYLEEERCDEALVFFVKADAQERIAELREQALGSGDVFGLQSIVRVTEEEPTQAEWQRVAEAAEAAGKERYAAAARRQLGLSES
jgi:hypothetical protein